MKTLLTYCLAHADKKRSELKEGCELNVIHPIMIFDIVIVEVSFSCN